MAEHAKTETITISRCPKCGGSHRYALEVRRSYVAAMLKDGVAPEPRRREFTRLFTCPTKESDFQVSFALRETFFDQIKTVSVVGPVKG
jgi:hypothetical protein